MSSSQKTKIAVDKSVSQKLVKFGSVFRRIEDKLLVVEFCLQFYGLFGKRKERTFLTAVNARTGKKANKRPWLFNLRCSLIAGLWVRFSFPVCFKLIGCVSKVRIEQMNDFKRK